MVAVKELREKLTEQMSVLMRISQWTFGKFTCGLLEGLANIFRGTRFTLSRDELLTLPEFVLLSLFPNGLLPDGHVNAYQEGDAFQVDVSHPLQPTQPDH